MASGAVTVNGQLASVRQGDFFRHQIAAANPVSTWVEATIAAGGSSYLAGTLIPPATFEIQYDYSGNLINDGNWVYTYDAMDRRVGKAGYNLIATFGVEGEGATQTLNLTNRYVWRTGSAEPGAFGLLMVAGDHDGDATQLKEAGGANLYSYAGNDPINQTDYRGMCTNPFSQIFGFVRGLIGSAVDALGFVATGVGRVLDAVGAAFDALGLEFVGSIFHAAAGVGYAIGGALGDLSDRIDKGRGFFYTAFGGALDPNGEKANGFNPQRRERPKRDDCCVNSQSTKDSSTTLGSEPNSKLEFRKVKGENAEWMEYRGKGIRIYGDRFFIKNTLSALNEIYANRFGKMTIDAILDSRYTLTIAESTGKAATKYNKGSGDSLIGWSPVRHYDFHDGVGKIPPVVALAHEIGHAYAISQWIQAPVVDLPEDTVYGDFTPDWEVQSMFLENRIRDDKDIDPRKAYYPVFESDPCVTTETRIS